MPDKYLVTVLKKFVERKMPGLTRHDRGSLFVFVDAPAANPA